MTLPYEVFKAGPRKGQPRRQVDRVIRYLVESQKAVEVDSPSRKYRCFTRPCSGSGNLSYYWVGPTGAVRVGPKSTGSISMTDTISRLVSKWEDMGAGVMAGRSIHSLIIDDVGGPNGLD
jgi:hypothetical protein